VPYYNASQVTCPYSSTSQWYYGVGFGCNGGHGYICTSTPPYSNCPYGGGISFMTGYYESYDACRAANF
jgi:hypothetical protein